MKARKIIVIGGGAAGLMAAGQAASHGAEVILLEKMKRLGMKICITGKGRCNITNIAEVSDFISHFGKGGRFLRQAFARFFSEDLILFFEELGLPSVKERGGRVFPKSGKAPDVQRVLRQWNESCGVKVTTSSPVQEILVNADGVTGVRVQGRIIKCDAVILATGGASYPSTGSTGDGYGFAEHVGHSIVPIRQALVPLVTKGGITKRMDKLNLRNINVRMYVNGKKTREAFGEILFTQFGLSGPTSLTLSGGVVDSLRASHKVVFSLDLKPALDDKKLDARLLRDIASRGKEDISSFLRGLMPKQMIPVCLELTDISHARLVMDISAKERKRLKLWLKDFSLEITGYRPFSEAIVTAGGVDTREVDPRTMESKKTKGLYLVGELLDLQADTGGYNLQAAFSTGWLAGRSAAKTLD